MKPYYQDDAVTIYHGDCREILPTLKANVVLTDPPYGIGKAYGPGYDDSPAHYWEWFLPAVQLMREAAPLVAFTHRIEALRHLEGWDHIAVWHKPLAFGSRMGNSPILPHWEPIFLYGMFTLGTKWPVFHDVLTQNPEAGSAAKHRDKGGGKRFMGRETNDVQGVGHPLPKPLALYRRLVSHLTLPGHLVIDPFMGSGTTLRAAKDLGRHAIGIEVEEAYCEQAAEKMGQQVLWGDAA